MKTWKNMPDFLAASMGYFCIFGAISISKQFSYRIEFQECFVFC